MPPKLCSSLWEKIRPPLMKRCIIIGSLTFNLFLSFFLNVHPTSRHAMIIYDPCLHFSPPGEERVDDTSYLSTYLFSYACVCVFGRAVPPRSQGPPRKATGVGRPPARKMQRLSSHKDKLQAQTSQSGPGSTAHPEQSSYVWRHCLKDLPVANKLADPNTAPLKSCALVHWFIPSSVPAPSI